MIIINGMILFLVLIGTSAILGPVSNWIYRSIEKFPRKAWIYLTMRGI